MVLILLSSSLRKRQASNSVCEVRQMTHLLHVLAALVKRVRLPTPMSDGSQQPANSSRGSDTLFWPPRVPSPLHILKHIFHYVPKDALELLIPLPPFLSAENTDVCHHAQVSVVLTTEPSTSRAPGKQSTNGAHPQPPYPRISSGVHN